MIDKIFETVKIGVGKEAFSRTKGGASDDAGQVAVNGQQHRRPDGGKGDEDEKDEAEYAHVLPVMGRDGLMAARVPDDQGYEKRQQGQPDVCQEFQDAEGVTVQVELDGQVMPGAQTAQFFAVRHPCDERAHEVPLFRLDLPGLEQVRIAQQNQASGGFGLVDVSGIAADKRRADHQGAGVVLVGVKLDRELVVLGFPVVFLRGHQQGIRRDALVLHGGIVRVQN